MSGDDIERTSFDQLADGGFDPDQVRGFLTDVARRVSELEADAAEAEQMRAAAADLVAQAEALVDRANERAEAAAAGVIADASAEAEKLTTEAQSRLDAARTEADDIREAARKEADVIRASAGAEEAAAGARAFADALSGVERIRRDAERTLEMAHVEATKIVNEAFDEAAGVPPGVALDSGEEGRAEVDRIVAEAEQLLEEARVKAASLLADATTQAEDIKTRADLSAEIHRAIEALRAVMTMRTSTDDSGELGAVRGRAVRMLGELRRTDGRLAPSTRADMLDELFEVQDMMKRVEARLIGRTEADADDDRVVVDLTDGADLTEDAPQGRPSRYQQRSANLPKIGRDVQNVSRAVRSIRDQLHDVDEE